MAFSHLSAVSVILALTSQTVSASPVQHRSIFKRAASGPWFTDFPDPGLIQGDDGNFYSFATNSGGYHIPTAFSTDGIGGNWQYIANDTDATRQWDALPVLPSWQPVENQQIWAPDVARMVSTLQDILFEMRPIQQHPMSNSNCYILFVPQLLTLFVRKARWKIQHAVLQCECGQSQSCVAGRSWHKLLLLGNWIQR